MGTLIACLGFAAGCGGDSGGSSSPPAPVKPKIDLVWGARSKTVNAPSSALSVLVKLKAPGAAEQTGTFNRHADPAGYRETVTFPTEVPVAHIEATYEFHANTDAGGPIVGLAYSSADMNTEGFGLDVVTTDGNISSISVPENQKLTVGETRELMYVVKDDAGQNIALAPGSVFWSTSDASVLSLGNLGATGVKRGSSDVTATVDGRGSSPVSVAVTNVAKVIPIAISGSTTPENATNCHVSGNGQVVFGLIEGNPFVWNKTMGVQMIADATDFHSFIPEAVSMDGLVAVGSAVTEAGARQACKFILPSQNSAAGAFAALGALEGSTSFESSATGISADGSVIVGTSASSLGVEAFRIQNGIMVGLGDFSTPDDGISFSSAKGVSGDGSVVIGSARTGDALYRGFRWTAASGFQDIGAVVTPDAIDYHITATAITRSGDQIVGYNDQTPWSWANGVSSVIPVSRFRPVAVGTEAVFGTSPENPAVMFSPTSGGTSIQSLVESLGLTAQLNGFAISNLTDCSAQGDVVVVEGIGPGSSGAFLIVLP